MLIYIIIGLIVLLIIYIFILYNSFVNSNNMVNEAFSTMDVYLKKRWNLIPNLVEIVKGYASHEKQTLEEIVKLRENDYENMSNNDKINSYTETYPRVEKLMALAENYPELKASTQFKNLSENLTKAEDEIANSRKYYNAVVRMFNNKVEMFPNNIFAHIFGFKSKKMFEAKAEERENVSVKL